MRRLTPFIAFDPRETPLSFASRLTEFHTGGALTSFLRDLGIKPEALKVGDAAALTRLAEATDVHVEALRANAAVLTGRQAYDLRGHALTSVFFASPETVYGPACLASDDAASGPSGAPGRLGRLPWTLRVVRTCPEHGIALARRPKLRHADVYHDLRDVAPSGAALDREIATLSRRGPSPLQAYVTDRLDGAVASQWLDAQTLENAVWASEMLGLALLRGPEADLKGATEDDRDRAGAIGFKHTAPGVEGIREGLTTLFRKHRYSGGRPGPQCIFGRLYISMASTETFVDRGDIKDIMRDFICETFEMPGAAMVLGQALPERRLHSVASLAKESGLDSRTLHGVLTACGVIPDDSRTARHAVFDAATGAATAAGVVRQITLRALPKRLNCARPLADQIAEERILAPLAAGGMAAGSRTSKAFDDRHVEALLGAFRNAAPEVAAPPPGWCCIAKAAERARVRGVDIVHLILGGHLSNICRHHIEGVAGLLVDPAEVRSVAARLLAGLAPVEAFRRLRIPASTGWALVEARGGGPLLTARRIAPARGNHEIVRIDDVDVAAFRARYASITHLMTAHCIEKKMVWRRLKEASVSPSACRQKIGIDLFDRARLPASLVF